MKGQRPALSHPDRIRRLSELAGPTTIKWRWPWRAVVRLTGISAGVVRRGRLRRGGGLRASARRGEHDRHLLLLWRGSVRRKKLAGVWGGPYVGRGRCSGEPGQEVRGAFGPGRQGEFAEMEKRGRGLAVEAHGGEQGGGNGEIQTSSQAKIGQRLDAVGG